MKSWILSDDELVDKIHTLKAHGMDVDRFKIEWDGARHKLTAHHRQTTTSDVRTISGMRFGGGNRCLIK